MEYTKENLASQILNGINLELSYDSYSSGSDYTQIDVEFDNISGTVDLYYEYSDYELTQIYVLMVNLINSENWEYQYTEVELKHIEKLIN